MDNLIQSHLVNTCQHKMNTCLHLFNTCCLIMHTCELYISVPSSSHRFFVLMFLTFGFKEDWARFPRTFHETVFIALCYYAPAFRKCIGCSFMTMHPGERQQDPELFTQGLDINSGNDLSSQAVSNQVLSARESLTSVFGMGTGVTSPL